MTNKDLLETVFFIKVMMLSIVGVKSFIIKSALNLMLSPLITISSTYDDESMADIDSLKSLRK
jgi:hypothetical protein